MPVARILPVGVDDNARAQLGGRRRKRGDRRRLCSRRDICADARPVGHIQVASAAALRMYIDGKINAACRCRPGYRERYRVRPSDRACGVVLQQLRRTVYRYFDPVFICPCVVGSLSKGAGNRHSP